MITFKRRRAYGVPSEHAIVTELCAELDLSNTCSIWHDGNVVLCGNLGIDRQDAIRLVESHAQQFCFFAVEFAWTCPHCHNENFGDTCECGMDARQAALDAQLCDYLAEAK